MGAKGRLAQAQYVQPVGEIETAPAAKGYWLDTTAQQWASFWSGAVAQACASTDLPTVYRLFDLRDEYDELWGIWRSMPVDERWVSGSKHRESLMEHPIGKRLKYLEGAILKLEQHFGLTPYSRARLGIELGDARMTWAKLAELEQEAQATGAQGAPITVSSLPVGRVKEQNDV